jgi:hypothetical protein
MNVVAWFIPALLRHCEEHSDEAISEISTLRSQCLPHYVFARHDCAEAISLSCLCEARLCRSNLGGDRGVATNRVDPFFRKIATSAQILTAS